MDSSGVSEAELDRSLAALHKDDTLWLDNNDNNAWSEALMNWVLFWDQIIVFKPVIFSALTEACTAFKMLIISEYNYAPKSPQTQSCYMHGTYLFTKQVMEVLAEGESISLTELVTKLGALPDMSAGNLLSTHFHGQMMEHFTHQNSKPKTSTREKNASVPKEPKEPKVKAKKPPAAKKTPTSAAAAAVAAAGTSGQQDPD